MLLLPTRWSIRGVAVFPALLGCALLLWFGSSLLLDLFPEVLKISQEGEYLSISIEGETGVVPVAAPIHSLDFVPIPPHLREYQIDGSDSTNNFTFDPDYFARIAGSPYYRFQALLRDDGSYSQWRNLSVMDAAGKTVLKKASPDGEVTLPDGFALSVQLRRLETPRTLELLDDSGARYSIEVNRNDKFVMVTEAAPGLDPSSVARWYFPNDWLPPAAELGYMAMRVAALAIILLLVVTAVAAALPGALAWVPGRPWSIAVPVVASAVALVGSGYAAVVLFDRAPHILDAVSYYFQAKLFASGRLAAPAPPLKEAFPTPFFVAHDGKWFSQYTPGTSLLLAVGFLLKVPWLVEPVLAAATVLVLFAIGRRHYGTNVALLATVLISTSPFLWLLAGSFMSHVPSTFFATIFLYAATRYLEKPARRWVVGGALALGCSLMIREATAVLYLATVGPYVVWKCLRYRKLKEVIPHLALGASILAAFGVVYLMYNWAQTGSPWLPPRLLFSTRENSFGFGNGIGFYGRHTPAAGLVNADEQLTSLTIVLFGWPFYFSLALMLMPFIAGRPRSWDLMHGSIFGAFVVAYVALYYHGIVFGPRYYFDALPSMVLLSARGFATLASTGSAILASIAGKAAWRPKVRTAALLLAGGLISCNLLYFIPREAELYKGYSGMPGGKGPELGYFVRMDLTGRQVVKPKSLITTDDWWIYTVYLAAMNPPDLASGAVLALMPPGEAGMRLLATYAGRDWYRVVIGSDGRLVLEYQGKTGARP